MTALSICFQQRTNQKLVLSSHEEAGEAISAELVESIIMGEKGLVMKNELKTLAKLGDVQLLETERFRHGTEYKFISHFKNGSVEFSELSVEMPSWYRPMIAGIPDEKKNVWE